MFNTKQYSNASRITAVISLTASDTLETFIKNGNTNHPYGSVAKEPKKPANNNLLVFCKRSAFLRMNLKIRNNTDVSITIVQKNAIRNLYSCAI